jgi:hypothetical protein
MEKSYDEIFKVLALMKREGNVYEIWGGCDAG